MGPICQKGRTALSSLRIRFLFCLTAQEKDIGCLVVSGSHFEIMRGPGRKTALAHGGRRRLENKGNPEREPYLCYAHSLICL